MQIPDRQYVDRLVAEQGIVAAGNRLGVAALIYTYRCTLACRHCGFSCSPERPSTHMTAEQVVRNLRLLHETGRVIHAAGGECMMFWDDFRRAVGAARNEGVSPHFVETNCSFAVGDEIVRTRLRELRDLGVGGILASSDPFHQEFVSPENFLRVRRIGGEVFGPRNVWCSDAPEARIRDLPAIARDAARLREYVLQSRILMVGTAHRDLEPFLPEFPLDRLPLEAGWQKRYATRECMTDFARDTMWEFHVDPYDNIMSNCGAILGRIGRTTPREVLDKGPENAGEIASLLARQGPFGLARMAQERHGYAPPQRARTKCGFCFEVRKFLRPHYPEMLGPAEVYGE